MQKLFNTCFKLFALFMFLPITPSIAAITVFTKLILIDRNNEVSFSPTHIKRVIDASGI